MRVPYSTFFMAFLVAAASGSEARSELVDRFTVGEGDQSAALQFDFLDGRTWVFDVAWTGELSGRGAFDLIAADTTGRFAFDFEIISYSFGDFLVGVTIEDASHHGTGTPPDYVDTWHYWTAETADEPWTESFIGFNDRALADGGRDGWVFGTLATPAVVPAPGVLTFGILGLAATRRRVR
jgi:hypothetical protein